MPVHLLQDQAVLTALPLAVWIGGVILVNRRARDNGYPALAFSLMALFLGPPAVVWALWVSRHPRPTSRELRELLQFAEARRMGVPVQDEDDLVARRFPGLGRLWDRAQVTRREPAYWTAVIALVRFEQTCDRLLLWRPVLRVGRAALTMLAALVLASLVVHAAEFALGRPITRMVPEDSRFLHDFAALAGSPSSLWLAAGLGTFLLWLRWYEPRLLELRFSARTDGSVRMGRALHLLNCALAAGESPAELPSDLLQEVGFDPDSLTRTALAGDLPGEAAVLAAVSATHPRLRPLVEVAQSRGRFDWLVEQMALQEHAQLKGLIFGMTLVVYLLMIGLGLAGLALGGVLVFCMMAV